ncbi:MAG: 50S ribosomal protein L32e [Thaumarchaeota archaeon]|nr:50S ribosomal protein L32e [Nitrososphaerota archaeon]MCL5317995.1 50S ribosomal protein L32e [Nitrososphaerota archaeon]
MSSKPVKKPVKEKTKAKKEKVPKASAKSREKETKAETAKPAKPLKKTMRTRAAKKPLSEAAAARVAKVQAVLKLRAEIADGRPAFQRPESWRYTRLKENWRKPKGLDNKVRKSFKGWPRLVKVGYRGPVAARGLHPSGFRDVLVDNLKGLDGLNPETDAVRLASTLGARKRQEIINRADELGLKVLNPCGIRVISEKEK